VAKGHRETERREHRDLRCGRDAEAGGDVRDGLDERHQSRLLHGPVVSFDMASAQSRGMTHTPVSTDRRAAIAALLGAVGWAAGRSIAMADTPQIIDALDQPHPRATVGTRWELIADRVMGGVSSGAISRETVAGRPALRMQGEVSLENNGGFIQVALDLSPAGAAIDASAWTGIEIDVLGDNERYNLHLRTADVVRPWQSYRAEFLATPEWRTIQLPFRSFDAHRIDAPLDLTRLRRLGVVAIGRRFAADVAIGGLRFYR
jgi:hypothetical protein